jgi:acylpyruvate hydrolase
VVVDARKQSGRGMPSAWIKATSAIIGPMRDIVRPAGTRVLNHGTQLAVVIGQQCKNITAARAYDVVAGYVVVNDISSPDADAFIGRMFDGFAPMGPWLVTKDEIEDLSRLTIRTRVNGEVHHVGSTHEMVVTVPELVASLSRMTLEPGDVITTGRVPDREVRGEDRRPLWIPADGDLLESEVEGIGILRNRIVDEA